MNKYIINNNTVTMYTSKGQSFIFDLEDLEKVKQYTWCMDSKRGYVIAYDKTTKKNIYLHRLIMNATDRKDFVDHIYNKRNDNRKSELRICSNAQNLRNRGLNKNNKSGCNGVSFNTTKKIWQAHININGKLKNLGTFKVKEEAIQARKQAEQIYYKDFAPTLEVN